jgi:hypothetical protein
MGSGSPVAAGQATDTSTQANEIDSALFGDDADNGGDGNADVGVNRTLPGAQTGTGQSISSSARAKSSPSLGTNFEGLNFNNQRFANHGNQFSVEPPDQGLCAGNGFVMESVNDVLRIWHSDGTPAIGVVDLNSFYGYPPAIIRSLGQDGPEITDPSCIYDQAIGRFVHVVLTLDRVGTTAALAGTNHLDIAVSDTGDPTGTWTLLSLPVQNNGTQGTPDHGCSLGFCLGDYPHIGADANGIYLTTNEFSLFGPGFYGAQVYAIGNSSLTGGSSLSAVLFDTLGAGPDGLGFTIWPAQSPGNQWDADNGGTEFFLSSDAARHSSHTSTTVLQWTMSNTSSLNTSSPTVSLDVTPITVNQYGVPPKAAQAAGSRPLSQCLADLTVYFPSPFFTCNRKIAGTASHNNISTDRLDSNDSRMQQVWYANGKLWGALDTAVSIGGATRAGIAYYVINPNASTVELQGTAGVASTDLTYPAVGVLDNGRGVITFTLTGDNDFPSAAFASLDDKIGMGPIQVAAAGVGPWDGFTSYQAFTNRPRWGDYGATAVDGTTIWIASEYVAQTCTYATYLADPTCGGTRGALGNWSTHVSQVTP